MDVNQTDYRTYPMDFTNIGDTNYNKDQERGIFSQPEGHVSNYGQFSPYSSAGPYWTDLSATDKRYPSDTVQRTDPRSADVVPPSPSMTSTPKVNETYANRQDLHRDIPARNWKWFMLNWVIIIVCAFAGLLWLIQTQPFHEFVCWIKENTVLMVLMGVILFLISLVWKLLKDESVENAGIANQQSPAHRTARGTPVQDNVRRRLDFEPSHSNETKRCESDREVIHTSGVTPGRSEIQVKRTFSGSDGDTWTDFLRYYENIARLNCWDYNRKRMVFFTTLRGQAETFVHGLPNDVQSNWDSLMQRMDLRFGHVNMKESYLAEAKLRRRKPGESFRDLGQAIEDLFRRAYPNNPELVQEGSIKCFLDSCGESEEFRLAVRRTKPKTLQEAVTSAMQEECIRLNERNARIVKRNVYSVDTESEIRNETNTTKSVGTSQVQKIPNERTPQRMNDRNSGSNKYNRYRGKVCSHCGKKGHSIDKCWSLQNSQANTNSMAPSDTVRDKDGTGGQLNGDRSEQ